LVLLLFLEPSTGKELLHRHHQQLIVEKAKLTHTAASAEARSHTAAHEETTQ
jgi:hypothetical protein